MANKENKVYKVLDIYVDNTKGGYDCICDVPNEERIYDCEHANSMMIECPTKESYDSIVAEFESQPHILYKTGTPIEEIK